MFRFALNGFREFLGGHLPEGQVDGRQVLAEKRVELRVIRGAVFRAKPPAPIAALGGQQGFARLAERRFARGILAAFRARIRGASKRFSGVPEQLPGRDIFAVSDPHVEVRIDPGGWKDSSRRGHFAGGRDRFADGKGAKILVTFDALVELAQKLASVARVVFPGVFTVEKQTNRERLGALHALAERPQSSMKVLRSGFSLHPAVDKPDQIGKMVIAE